MYAYFQGSGFKILNLKMNPICTFNPASPLLPRGVIIHFQLLRKKSDNWSICMHANFKGSSFKMENLKINYVCHFNSLPSTMGDCCIFVLAICQSLIISWFTYMQIFRALASKWRCWKLSLFVASTPPPSTKGSVIYFGLFTKKVSYFSNLHVCNF